MVLNYNHINYSVSVDKKSQGKNNNSTTDTIPQRDVIRFFAIIWLKNEEAGFQFGGIIKRGLLRMI